MCSLNQTNHSESDDKLTSHDSKPRQTELESKPVLLMALCLWTVSVWRGIVVKTAGSAGVLSCPALDWQLAV